MDFQGMVKKYGLDISINIGNKISELYLYNPNNLNKTFPLFNLRQSSGYKSIRVPVSRMTHIYLNDFMITEPPRTLFDLLNEMKIEKIKEDTRIFIKRQFSFIKKTEQQIKISCLQMQKDDDIVIYYYDSKTFICIDAVDNLFPFRDFLSWDEIVKKGPTYKEIVNNLPDPVACITVPMISSTVMDKSRSITATVITPVVYLEDVFEADIAEMATFLDGVSLTRKCGKIVSHENSISDKQTLSRN